LELIKELYYDARPNKSQDSYGRFGKTYRSHPQGSRIQKDTFLAALTSTLPSIPTTCDNPTG